MESFFCRLEIGGLDSGSSESMDVLASDRSGFLHLPRTFLYRLGISPTRAAKFERPDGSIVEMGIADVRVRYEDRSGATPVVFDDDDATPWLGHVTLTGLSLKLDQAEQKLVYNPPLMKPPWWYEYQQKLKEAIERIEAERGSVSAPFDSPTNKGE